MCPVSRVVLRAGEDSLQTSPDAQRSERGLQPCLKVWYLGEPPPRRGGSGKHLQGTGGDPQNSMESNQEVTAADVKTAIQNMSRR